MHCNPGRPMRREGRRNRRLCAVCRQSGALLVGGYGQPRRVAVVADRGAADREGALVAMTTEERARPAEERTQSVPEPGEEHEVHGEPHEPPGEAAEAHALELHDGAEPPDRGHAPEVD